jgi:hypothetical protein
MACPQEDWEEFNQLSLEGIWPAMDYMGHYVLGMFRNAAHTSRLECVNLAVTPRHVVIDMYWCLNSDYSVTVAMMLATMLKGHLLWIGL